MEGKKKVCHCQTDENKRQEVETESRRSETFLNCIINHFLLDFVSGIDR